VRKAEAQQLEEERLSMSSVMRKDLPRPTVVNPDLFAPFKGQSEIEKMINEEMLILMVHDNQKYPLRGMKASRLPDLKRQKTQYSSTELDSARQMIREEAERMGLIKDDEQWPEHLDNEMIYSKDNLVSRKSCSKDAIVSHLKHTLGLQNKLIEKEAKKCGKYGQAIEVMFKKYQTMAG